MMLRSGCSLFSSIALFVATAHVLQLLLPWPCAIPPRPCWGRKVKDLVCPYSGGECREPEKPWQHDGVCIIEKGRERGNCVLPETRTFRFAVVAKHRRLSKIRGAKAVKELWVRGSGPGLSWDKAVRMKKTAIVDEWKLAVEYRSDSDAVPCHSSEHCIYNQRALEMRLYRDEQGTDEMYGPNFLIPLPLSHSMSGAQDFLMPKVTVYPWFDVDKITVREKEFSYEVDTMLSSDAIKIRDGVEKMMATLKYQLLLPPSYHANVRKTYPLVLVWGSAKHEWHQITHLLESLFVYEASIEETVVVFLDYKDSAPFCRLSPYTGGKIWRCKGGGECHDCMSCWNPTRPTKCGPDTFRSQAKRCLNKLSCRGHGEEILNTIDQKLIPHLLGDEETKKRLSIDSLHHRVTMIGFEGAGLLACHAALTRPRVYANAACLSAPFSWPLQSLDSPGDRLGYNGVLDNITDRIITRPGIKMIYLTQKYFIDSAVEDNFFFPVVDAQVDTENFISRLIKDLGLEMNDNIWYSRISNVRYNYHFYDLTNEKPLLHRIRQPLLYFFGAEGSVSWEFLEHKLEMDAAIQSATTALPPEADQPQAAERHGQWGTGVNDTRFSCLGEGQSRSLNLPVSVYLMSVAFSILLTVAVTALIMWLREINRRAVEEEKDADMTGSSSSSGEELE